VPRYYQYEDYPEYNGLIVADQLTGLHWMRDANCMQSHYPWIDSGEYGQVNPGDPNEYIDYPGDGAVDWPSAINFVAGINSGNYPGCAPLYDACVESGGLWSLPNKDELESLVDERFPPPRVSNAVGDMQTSEGDPFLNIYDGYYWSMTEYVTDPPPDPNAVWVVSVSEGSVKSASTGMGDNFHSIWLVCREASPPPQ
jgi:hypothetical protein